MRNKKEPKVEKYSFIKETIKKESSFRGRFIKKAVGTAAGGLLFGGCAAFAFAVCYPAALSRFQESYTVREDISLTDHSFKEETSEKTEASGGIESFGSAEDSNGSGYTERTDPAGEHDAESLTEASGNPLLFFDEIYGEVLKIAEEPRKALVRVTGLSDNSNLLDDSFLSYGDEDGIVFLKNDTDYYILTAGESLADATRMRVTFSDGAAATGILCKTDERTGIAVLRVPLDRLREKTVEYVTSVSLSDTYRLQQAETVIAVGSPAGDYDAVDYGSVTSVTGRFTVPDGEYRLVTTDMIGSPDGGGILLNTSGEAIGLIKNPGNDNADILKAVSVADLMPLIEQLSNGDAIRYIGIVGGTISVKQAENLEIPRGIYVNSVEKDSPAMKAGVRNGDIIHALDGTELENMREYEQKLQELEIGDKVKISLYRCDAVGNYVDMNLKVIIEEK